MKGLGIFLAVALAAGRAMGAPAERPAAEPFDVTVPGIKADPLILQGDFTPPKTEGAPVLICLHGLGSVRAEWEPLVAQAASRGWGAYIYDARGHGRSRATLKGAPVDYQDRRMGEKPEFWQAMVQDAARVAQALEKQKGISPERRFFVGASLGANVALLASSTASVAGVVMLSPGLEYAGIAIEDAMSQLELPVLVVAAKPDLYAFTSSERLVSVAPKDRPATYWPLDKGTAKGVHGTQLFNGKLEKDILDWMAKKGKPAQKPDKPKR